MPRRPFVGNRPVAIDREYEFLVLGADAELRLRLHARFEPRDQLVARFDRRHVDLVASHAGGSGERAATLPAAARESNWVMSSAPSRTPHNTPKMEKVLHLAYRRVFLKRPAPQFI